MGVGWCIHIKSLSMSKYQLHIYNDGLVNNNSVIGIKDFKEVWFGYFCAYVYIALCRSTSTAARLGRCKQVILGLCSDAQA